MTYRFVGNASIICATLLSTHVIHSKLSSLGFMFTTLSYRKVFYIGKEKNTKYMYLIFIVYFDRKCVTMWGWPMPHQKKYQSGTLFTDPENLQRMERGVGSSPKNNCVGRGRVGVQGLFSITLLSEFNPQPPNPIQDPTASSHKFCVYSISTNLW